MPAGVMPSVPARAVGAPPPALIENTRPSLRSAPSAVLPSALESAMNSVCPSSEIVMPKGEFSGAPSVSFAGVPPVAATL